jgi:hypothetical protein
MSVPLSVCPHRTTWYLSFFRTSVQKIQVPLKSDKNNAYFTWRRLHVYDYLSEFFLEWEILWIKVVEKLQINILCHFLFPSENRAVYEIMSKNVVEPERPQKVILRRIACWISKATRVQAHASAIAPTSTHARTRTHTQKYVIRIAFPR